MATEEKPNPLSQAQQARANALRIARDVLGKPAEGFWGSLSGAVDSVPVTSVDPLLKVARWVIDGDQS